MTRCKGLHCPGCKRGGSGAGALLFFVLILVAAALARPIKHAANSALHMVIEVAEIAALVAGTFVGLAVICGLVVAGVRIRRWMLARPSYTVSIERPSTQDSRTELHPSNVYAIRPAAPPVAPPWSVASAEVIARSDQRRRS
jgi:nucleoside recognition membrane protein YjiH